MKEYDISGEQLGMARPSEASESRFLPASALMYNQCIFDWFHLYIHSTHNTLSFWYSIWFIQLITNTEGERKGAKSMKKNK